MAVKFQGGRAIGTEDQGRRQKLVVARNATIAAVGKLDEAIRMFRAAGLINAAGYEEVPATLGHVIDLINKELRRPGAWQ